MSCRLALCRDSFTALLIVLLSNAAFAQTETTPFQIAGEFSALGLDRDLNFTTGIATIGTAGFGVRTEVTLAPGFELETRLTWFPAEVLLERQAQGGHTLQAAAGIRGKVWTSRH